MKRGKLEMEWTNLEKKEDAGRFLSFFIYIYISVTNKTRKTQNAFDKKKKSHFHSYEYFLLHMKQKHN